MGRLRGGEEETVEVGFLEGEGKDCRAEKSELLNQVLTSLGFVLCAWGIKGQRRGAEDFPIGRGRPLWRGNGD